jgi:hypothetical protein
VSDEQDVSTSTPADRYEPPEVEELDTEEGPAVVGGGGPATAPG